MYCLADSSVPRLAFFIDSDIAPFVVLTIPVLSANSRSALESVDSLPVCINSFDHASFDRPSETLASKSASAISEMAGFPILFKYASCF